MVPLESLRTVSYSHSIVTGRIFSRFDLCSKIRILRSGLTEWIKAVLTVG